MKMLASSYIIFVRIEYILMLQKVISYQVLASKAKIYMVLEYVNGGELFERIVSRFLFCRVKAIIVMETTN